MGLLLACDACDANNLVAARLFGTELVGFSPAPLSGSGTHVSFIF